MYKSAPEVTTINTVNFVDSVLSKERNALCNGPAILKGRPTRPPECIVARNLRMQLVQLSD
jgi:hypothetical protein